MAISNVVSHVDLLSTFFSFKVSKRFGEDFRGRKNGQQEALRTKMFSGVRKFLKIMLAVLIGMSLISCAALNRTEADNPDYEKSQSQKKIPLPPTIKDFDGDSE